MYTQLFKWRMLKFSAHFTILMSSLLVGIPFTHGGAAAQITGFTYQRADGNRFVEGRGRLPDAPPIDIQIEGRPAWLVAAPDGDSAVWVVLLEDGEVQGFRSKGTAVESISIQPSKLPLGAPPLLVVHDGKPGLMKLDIRTDTVRSHPVFFPRSGKTVAVQNDGAVLLRNGMKKRFSIDALPDARPIFDEGERVLLLTGRTDAYRHGVLGDTVEAQSVTLLVTVPEPYASRIITLQPDTVIEGISPIWSDMNGDGSREIILTVSDSRRGARFAVYNEQGVRIASGPAVGRGYRWRHQIAVAPFGPEGEIELAGVKTPHINGVVEFFRLDGNALRKTASIKGFSSHVLGSHNLDMAAAGDFDGDGSIELLVPTQSLRELAAVRHTVRGARQVWALPLQGRLSTNLAAATLRDGSIALGAGTEDGTLLLWLPGE